MHFIQSRSLQLTPHKFAEEFFEEKTSSGLSLQETFPGCKWVFPSSQTRYSTVFQDELDEWFDICSLTDPSAREELQIEGLHDSLEFIHGIISEEAKFASPERVILLGLSQGSATCKLSKDFVVRRLPGFCTDSASCDKAYSLYSPAV